MGWVIDINSDSPIESSQVDSAINSLPDNLKGWHLSKQSWGWTAAVDVSNPQGNTIKLSGSYTMSGMIAEDFSWEFSKRLSDMGHCIKIGKMEG